MTIKTHVVGFLQYARGDDVQTYLQRWLAQSWRQTDVLFDPVTGHNHNGQGTNGPTVSGGGGITMQWRGAWNAATGYVQNDGVSYNGSSYIALHNVTSSTPPPSDPTNWGVLAQAGSAGATGPEGPPGAQGNPGAAGPAGPTGATGATGATGPQGSPGPTGPAGITWRGAWQTAPTTYVTGDGVSYNGSSYIAITGNVASPPPSSSWNLLAQEGATGATGAQGPPGADSTVPGPPGATGPEGPTGPTGATGATGAQGPPGQGVPSGGTAGQALIKNSATNYDTIWQTPGPPVWG